MSDFNLSSFVASFFDEAKQRLSSINQRLVAFESGSLDEDELNRLRRDAHTIKGSALMLGVVDVGEMAHLFEDVMETLINQPEKQSPEIIQFLFNLHDLLAERLEHQETADFLNVNKSRAEFEALCKKNADKSTLPEVFTSEVEDNSREEVHEILTQNIPLIGVEESIAWKHSVRETENFPDKSIPEEPDIILTSYSENDFMEEEALVSEYNEGTIASENISDFRPDISKYEMQPLGTHQNTERFLRVDAGRLDRLSNQVMNLTIEKARGSGMVDKYSGLIRSTRDLRRHWRQFQNHLTNSNAQLAGVSENALKSLDELFDLFLNDVQHFGNEMRYEQDKGAIVINDIRDQILGLMLRPLDSVFSTFPRAVRDIAVGLNRKVQLQIGGKSVEMDLAVVEALVEPLIHLLNNAIAHGIESPEERRQAGKPEEGLISILAKQNGSEVNIEVVDDGCGIDVEQVKAVAVQRGVTTQFEADQMDSVEILEMIFRPGFSTYEDVDKLAGRGMGMNVVQDTVRKLTGSIRIHTEKGKGTRFLLSLPVSIAVQHSLKFRIGDLNFGMLTHLIEHVMPLDKLENATVATSGKDKGVFATYGKHHIPLVDLRHVLKKRKLESPDPYVIIAKHIEGYVGIVADELFDESEIIVRDIDPYLKRYQAPGLMGNTIDNNGSVLLLIEPYGIKEMGRTAPELSLQEEYAAQQDQRSDFAKKNDSMDELALRSVKLEVLLVEDSLIAREIEKAMLLSSGFSVRTAIDGIDAMDKVRSEHFDLIVTDLEMPRLDGFGLVRQIRNESRFEDIPILVISTRESAEDRMRALDAGADAYLVKQQLSHSGLRETLRKFFGSLTSGDDSNTNRPLKKAPIV